jgi:Ca2+-binding EF-hand superfamily protein
MQEKLKEMMLVLRPTAEGRGVHLTKNLEVILK